MSKMIELTQAGYIIIGNEPDRLTMCSLLIKNGYTARIARRRKPGNAKTYEYLVAFKLNGPDDEFMPDMPEEGENTG